MGLKGVNPSIQYTEKWLREEIIPKLQELIDTTSSVELTTEQVNLNTDTLEALIQYLTEILQIHDYYKAYDLEAVLGSFAELILPDEFTAFAISNGAKAVIEIKLNDLANDSIILEKMGSITHDKFKVSKLYYRSASSSNFTAVFTKFILP